MPSYWPASTMNGGAWHARPLPIAGRCGSWSGAHARPLAPEVRIRRIRPKLHPDQEAAIERIADAFEAALGCNVEVTAAAGGYRAHLHFASLEDALGLAQRLGEDPVSPPSVPR